MEPITLEQLKTGLVRCAERWPDRVGPCNTYGRDGNYCIVGQLTVDLGAYESPGGISTFWQLARMTIGSLSEWHVVKGLLNQAIAMNDAGLPWRQIVIELGLITPEQPVTQPEEVELATV